MGNARAAGETTSGYARDRRRPLPGKDSGSMEESFVISVPIDQLDVYGGTVCGDVIGENGAILLPAGMDLSLVSSSIASIKRSVQAQGISSVSIRLKPQFSERDIENIFEKIYTDDNALISKEQARFVVRQVDALFSSVRNANIGAEMISPLVDVGTGLAEEILRNSSVALSLGKVQNADEYTMIHSFNVAVLAGFLANRLHKGDRDYLQKVVLGALLHDMGKAQIPLEILNKPGPLTTQEFGVMKGHPNLGLELAKSSGIGDGDILDIIVGHHEKWSGQGYPAGRRGGEISEPARIVAVADVFDALTAKRVYKAPLPAREALMLIMKEAGGHFDTRIARELLVSLGLYPPGSIVSLSDGTVGLVVSNGGTDLVRPVLMVRKGKAGQSEETPVFVDLKTTTDLYISYYLGHGSKRDLSVNERADAARA